MVIEFGLVCAVSAGHLFIYFIYLFIHFLTNADIKTDKVIFLSKASVLKDRS